MGWVDSYQRARPSGLDSGEKPQTNALNAVGGSVTGFTRALRVSSGQPEKIVSIINDLYSKSELES
jgi:hypothetical protein